ncbi:serine/threonine kinase, putative [Ricinus communis]|uniref:non-specific serine/threonine protein kinase n=1 Tax=Ricinus communis TaxID=3988 RepID=B9SLY4_RICCO|nr:serine/threonine kinase, putative [Ricinus communis]|eukprot:XP_025014505.1 LEAF RUST 10 DISEASE-RESISTANCE LOCUS RECEPTOR-LIKE PROTEIN KINASE-like 2.1 [Ricinus communis]
MLSKPAPVSSVLSSFIITLSLIISTTFPTHIKSQNSTSDYDLCTPFKCGNITFSFPFSSLTFGSGPKTCGLPSYQITCDDLSSGIILSGRFFQVKDLYLSDRLITAVDIQLIKDLTAGSCSSLRNFTVSSTYNPSLSLSLPPGTLNFTLLMCPAELELSKDFLEKGSYSFTCMEGDKLYVWDPPSQLKLSPLLAPSECSVVTVPSNSFLNISNGTSDDHRIQLAHILVDGFALTWPDFKECTNCSSIGGRCGFDGSLGRIVCFHKPGSSKKNPKKGELIIGIATGSCFTLLLVVLLVLKGRVPALKRKKNQNTENRKNVEQFVKTYQSALLSNYSYRDIRKMTNGFREKLGEGGYGNVYKGRLSDGRLVAIKLLEKLSSNGRDFVNEVATIGTIHHFNVIRLLGFSWNGSKQALIYEYMPNGSLADLLSNGEFSLSLRLSRMLEIAIGIAHGIEYLHNGCESRILHLDIKPQNVLLDQNLNPKISDFGLAKIYSRNRSVVTMTDARGTIGYIAPEIFMRNLGNPSHKSDVYSYGMLLLEMVGGRKQVERNILSTSSEAYFPDWIYDKLIEEKNIEIADSIAEEDDDISRKMITVGLW